MSESYTVLREYHGPVPPAGAQIPGPAEILKICVEKCDRYNLGVPFPSENPVFWIKYGFGILWTGEMEAQNMAYRELSRSNSTVRAPRAFYACEINSMVTDSGHDEWVTTSYLVMDFMEGKTADCWINGTEDESVKDNVYGLVALALSELHRIPIPPRSRPAAMDGGRIRHNLFDERECPREYQNTQQLEDHLNLFLQLTKRKSRVKNMAFEPLIFCYSDIWLKNFLISDAGHVSIVDFAETSILPSSFARYSIEDAAEKIQRNIIEQVYLPTTSGIDNTYALCEASVPMVLGPGSFVSTGRRIDGG